MTLLLRLDFAPHVERAAVDSHKLPSLIAQFVKLLLSVHKRNEHLVFIMFVHCYKVLALNTSVGITTSQTFYLSCRHQVEVAGDGMLQGAGSHSKLEGLALCSLRQQTMDESA